MPCFKRVQKLLLLLLLLLLCRFHRCGLTHKDSTAT
jgi:hypothetical protein